MLNKKKIFNVFIFGSAELRLALQGSDVDIFVDIQGITWKLILYLNSILNKNFSQIIIIIFIFLDKIPDNFLYSLKKAIHYNRLFIRSFVIEARIPLLRCVHQSGISCDIVCSDSFGVANTKLINVLFESDERFIFIFIYIYKLYI